jgi:hypothetical protein
VVFAIDPRATAWFHRNELVTRLDLVELSVVAAAHDHAERCPSRPKVDQPPLPELVAG